MEERKRRTTAKIDYDNAKVKMTTAVSQVPKSDAVLPVQAQRLYGCSNCEWKGTTLCPLGFKRDSKEAHLNGICSDRANWLASFAPSNHAKFSEWQLEFNKALAQAVNLRDYQKMMQLDAELRSLQESGADPKEVKQKHKALLLARSDWQFLWRDLTKFDNLQVQRETPQILEVRKAITPEDIHKIMRDAKKAELEAKAIDAEFVSANEKARNIEKNEVNDGKPNSRSDE